MHSARCLAEIVISALDLALLERHAVVRVLEMVHFVALFTVARLSDEQVAWDGGAHKGGLLAGTSLFPRVYVLVS